MAKSYDAIIIGAGQAGSPLAHKLADLDWKVALIEKEYLGGSCINYGCTPTKTMVASARTAHMAHRAADFGVNVGDVSVDLVKVVQRKNDLVLSWRQSQQDNVDSRPTLDLYRGHGRFTNSHTIEVKGELLTSEKIFINTGTRPRIINLPGLDSVEYLTNKNIMDMTELPRDIVMLGGSYLGLEFGQMFQRFGSQVHVIEYNDRIISREDPEVSETLQAALEDEGMRFYLGMKTTAVSKTEHGVAIIIEDNDGNPQKVEGEKLFLGIGRTPNTDELGLNEAGIDADKYGYIKVNGKLETNVPGIWAMGDVKGGYAFTHVSYDDHLIIYDNLIDGKERTTDGRIIPYALFTDPEMGRVGMTETQAREAGYNLKIGKIPMEWVARAIERSETKGLMKIVIDADSDQILGATILGIEGGEIVQILMMAMRNNVPWTSFYRDMYIHPTVAEGLFALMDNVRDV